MKQSKVKHKIVPESKALAAEKTLKSEWHIYQPSGEFVPAAKFDFAKQPELKDVFAYETVGTRIVDEAPPHIKLMREQEFADYEPASDSGNLRWYPKGMIIKKLLEHHITSMAIKYGAMEVETPIMYDYKHPALSKYLQRFPARQYVVKSEDKEFFLRFAACFGQYMIKHDMIISHKNLPVCLYELTHYSFRREQTGELAGLRRLRTFTMPDMHTLTKDSNMAQDEFIKHISLCLHWLDDLNLKCTPVIRFVRSFLDENPNFISKIMKVINRPTLVEIWDERFFYFVVKFEMNFVDTTKKSACLSTVQIDVENSERFDINYIDQKGTKKHPLLLHTSISGSIDRNIYAILESQIMRMKKGEKAYLPFWLSPVQIRILPIAQRHLEKALQLAKQLLYRLEIDDRNLKINKKIHDLEKEWIPYAIVIGDKELTDKNITIRPRLGEQVSLPVAKFTKMLSLELAGKPKLASNTPLLLSKRPIFVG
jgi:threonyl-tRNA synthetase